MNDGLYMTTNPFIINSTIKEFGFLSPSSCLNLTYYLTYVSHDSRGIRDWRDKRDT